MMAGLSSPALCKIFSHKVSTLLDIQASGGLVAIADGTPRSVSLHWLARLLSFGSFGSSSNAMPLSVTWTVRTTERRLETDHIVLNIDIPRAILALDRCSLHFAPYTFQICCIFDFPVPHPSIHYQSCA